MSVWDKVGEIREDEIRIEGVRLIISTVDDIWSVDCALVAVVMMFKVDFDVVGPLLIVAEEGDSTYGVGEGRVGEDCLISTVDDVFSVDSSLFAVVMMCKVDCGVVGPLFIVAEEDISTYGVGEGRVVGDCLKVCEIDGDMRDCLSV